jgi:hypothetical protein
LLSRQKLKAVGICKSEKKGRVLLKCLRSMVVVVVVVSVAISGFGRQILQMN